MKSSQPNGCRNRMWRSGDGFLLADTASERCWGRRCELTEKGGIASRLLMGSFVRDFLLPFQISSPESPRYLPPPPQNKTLPFPFFSGNEAAN